MKGHKIIIILAIFSGLFLFLIYLYWINLFCLIKDDFPGEYDYNDVIIFTMRSSPIGSYYILIYGNGSAYYLSDFRRNMSGKTEARAGVLSQEKIEKIINLFKEKKFVCLKEKYESFIPVSDGTLNRVSFTINGVEKNVIDRSLIIPPPFLKEIMDNVKSIVTGLPKIKPEETYAFCYTFKVELDKITGIRTGHWMDGCRDMVNASFLNLNNEKIPHAHMSRLQLAMHQLGDNLAKWKAYLRKMRIIRGCLA